MSHCVKPGWLGVGSLVIPLVIFIVAPLVHLVIFDHFLPGYSKGQSTLITGGFYALLVLWMFASVMASRAYKGFRIDQVDVLFLILLAGIGISAAWYGSNPWLKFAPFFMVAPYFVARLLDPREFSVFFTALAALCIVAAVLVSFEIADTFGKSVPRRFVLAFGYDHGGGIASNVLGILLVLTVAYLAYPHAHRLTATVWAAALLLLWLVALLVDLQFRAAIYGALLVSAGLIILSKANLQVRLVLAAYLCASVIVSGMLLTHGSPRFLLAPVTESASSWKDKSLVAVHKPQSVRAETESASSWSDESRSQLSSVQQRKVFFVIAVRETIAHPFAGIGAGRFAEVSGIPGAYPHNAVLQAFTELGVIGGSLYLGMAVWLAWRLFGLLGDGRDVRRKWAWYVMGLWAYLFVIELVGGNYFTSATYWLVSGLAVSLIKSGGDSAGVFRLPPEADSLSNKSGSRP